jgi:hypothetical protein
MQDMALRGLLLGDIPTLWVGGYSCLPFHSFLGFGADAALAGFAGSSAPSASQVA